MNYKIQSPSYLKTVRRLTNQVKLLRGLSRIPNARPQPGSKAYSPSNNMTHKDLQNRQEAFIKQNQFRADKQSIAFFAVPYGLSDSK